MAMLVLLALWTTAFFFSLLFLCRDHWSALWGSQMGFVTYCVNTLQHTLAFALSDMIMDVLVIIMPIPMVRSSYLSQTQPRAHVKQIWSLQISSKRKFEISGVFLLATV